MTDKQAELIDRERVIARADLLTLIGRDTDLKRVASTNGGEWAGPCPMCGGTDRLHVQPNADPAGWFCASCTGRPHPGRPWKNAIDYVMMRQALDFRAACEYLTGGNLPTTSQQPRHVTTAKPYQHNPPDSTWQARGRAFVAYAQEKLWQDDTALDYLRGRGLADETIRAAGLGWNPTEIRDKPASWGVVDCAFVWLPCGWVFPWEISGQLWRIEIRQPEGGKVGPKGYKQGLYNADLLTADKPVVLVEGVIDALTIQQAAGDMVTAVATGATSHARRPRWIARLAMCSLVLVAFDNEPDKGDKAAEYWLNVLPNAKRWRPFWDDVNQMAQDGADILAWVKAGLALVGARPAPESKPDGWPKYIIWPADSAAATIAGNWQRLTDGSIRAIYQDADELRACLELMQILKGME